MDDAVAGAFDRVFDDDDYHNIASFEIESPRGDFTLQYTTSIHGGYVWNICSEPPRLPPDRYEIAEVCRSGDFLAKFGVGEVTLLSVLAESIGGTREGARVEFDELVSHVGGDNAVVADVETYCCGTGNVRQDFKDLCSRAKDRVASKLGVTA